MIYSEGLSTLACPGAPCRGWDSARLREHSGRPAAEAHGADGRRPVSGMARDPCAHRHEAAWSLLAQGMGDRPRLLSELTGTDPAKLVLVNAPAGFGKTTLLAQWRSTAAEGRPVAWLLLDHGDDDPGRLWWHVVSALQQACPELGAEVILGVLAVRKPDIPGTVIPMLVNKLMGVPVQIVLSRRLSRDQGPSLP